MPDEIIIEEITIEEEEEEYIPEQPDYTTALKKVYDWFCTDREAKTEYTAEMEEMYKLYKGDHWDLLKEDGQPLRSPTSKKIRPNLVENIAFSLIEGLVSEFSGDIDLVDYPVEEGDDEKAKVMTDLKEFIAYKNRISKEKAKWLRWFFLYGTGIWHVYWDPSWKGGRGPNRWIGDIRWKALHPQALFPDSRCLESIDDGMRMTKAMYKTQEHVKEKYGVEVPSDLISENMLIGDEAQEILTSEIGEERVLLGETWYKGEPLFLAPGEESQGYGMHIVWWAGDTAVPTYLGHANYVYYDPGEDCYFPVMMESCYPRENSIWGFGEMYYMKHPQITRNKTAELILEANAHLSLGQTFYDPNALTREQLKKIEMYGSLPNMWFPVNNPQGINRIFGRGASDSLFKETDRAQKTMEAIIGRFDISQGRTPGSVTAFRALDLLAERAQVRLRSKEKALTSSYEDCGNYINNLITRFYNEKRAYRIIGKENDQTVYVNMLTGQRIPEEQLPPGTIGEMLGPEWQRENDPSEKPTYGIFRGDMLRKVYVYSEDKSYSIDEFMPGEMIEGIHYETYCSEFDTVCRVSTSMPTDRMFYMEMAKELFMGKVIDEETFFYVISTGRFPPWEEMIQKSKEKQMMVQQQMLQGQAASQAMPGQIQMPQQIAMALDANPELKEQFASLSPEQQDAVISGTLNQGGGGMA